MSHCVIKLTDNKIVSGFSQHSNILFYFILYFYLDGCMFWPLDHHQAMFCKDGLMMVKRLKHVVIKVKIKKKYCCVD